MEDISNQPTILHTMNRTTQKPGMMANVHEVATSDIEMEQRLEVVSKPAYEMRSRQEPTPPHTRSQSPMPSVVGRLHTRAVKASFDRMSALKSGAEVMLNGKSLEIADVVAVAK